MWDGKAWDALRRAFPDDNNGSRVILTTREAGVGAYIDSSASFHEMHLLDDDQSWDLLSKKLFAKEPYPPEFEEIGRLVSKKCKGLPLAVVAIAGVLSTELTLEHWDYVAENMTSALSNSGNDLFELLSLSYTHLPHYLKPCFLYFGGFPEDYPIESNMLVRLWTAEGFLETNESMSPEEVAEEYLEDLVRRNLVLVLSRGYYNDKIEYCSIHDILREWCLKRVQEERFFFHLKHDYESEYYEASVNQRRISTHINTWGKMFDSSKAVNNSGVRTILFFGTDHKVKKNIRCYRLLRVLEARGPYIEIYHPRIDKVVELSQLRYISLYIEDDRQFELPTSITKLLNLQTLILKVIDYYKGTLYLPDEIWRIPQLRHLIIEPRLCSPPPPSTMENLQTLSAVFDLIWTPEVVKFMPNLKELALGYSFNIQKAVNHLKNLGSMTRLERLSFVMFTKDSFSWDIDALPENLVFPATLKFLQLERCNLPWESMTIIGSLPNLEALKLIHDAFKGEEWETSDGKFPQLRVLHMKRMGSLCRWTVDESSHFPKLKRLCLEYCGQLEEIPENIGEISSLELIEVKNCNTSIEESARRILDEQRDNGNDLLQVQIKNEESDNSNQLSI